MALTKASRSMLNTGISDSSDATALTFDSSENATFAGTITSTGTITGNLTGNVTGNVTGNASGTALTVTQAAQTAITSLGTLTGLTTSGAATVGGNLTVTGNLQVDGTTTTINSTSYTVDDKNITLASGAGSSSAADGGGITIDGANATWNYVHSTTSWDSNKAIRSTNGFVGPLTGNVTGNTSGTAATVTGAAQSAITSVGTLTALTVDDITIDSSTISDAGDLTITGETIALRTDSSSLATALSIDAAHNTTLAGHLIVDGNTTLGNADTDTVTIPGPCLLYTSPSPRDGLLSRMPSSA